MKSEPPRVALLSAIDLKGLFDAGEPVLILDVREPNERAYSAIAPPPTAIDVHIPMAEIPARAEAIQAQAADLPVVVYCHHGVRSMAVAEWLARYGVGRLHNLEGGIDAWSVRVDRSVPRY